jgi:hypothetical protein
VKNDQITRNGTNKRFLIRAIEREEVNEFFRKARNTYNRRRSELEEIGKERNARAIKGAFAAAVPEYLDGVGTSVYGIMVDDSPEVLGLVAIRNDGVLENGTSVISLDYLATLPELWLDDSACKPGAPLVTHVMDLASREVEFSGRVVIPLAFEDLEPYYGRFGFVKVKNGEEPHTIHMEYIYEDPDIGVAGPVHRAGR